MTTRELYSSIGASGYEHQDCWRKGGIFHIRMEEPIHVNRRLRAVLTFADGSKEDWSPLGPDSRSKVINLFYARSFK